MKKKGTSLSRGVPARVWLGVLALSVALTSSPVYAAMNTVVAGVGAGIGIAADPSGNAVYYVEWNAGTLKRIALTPGCDTAPPGTCAVTTVASGFSHPQDVALDLVHNVAYVTTRDDVGTTGKLWRVDLATGIPSLVTFNLGAPHQIALDVATNTAYVVGFDLGRLWKINLDDGSKETVVAGLGNPIGLVITADRTAAYVTEQSPARLSRIDLALRTRSTVVDGLTSPFSLQWTDAAQTTLLVVQRDPANNVQRVDIPTSGIATAITGLPVRPSGITINASGGAAYVATETTITRVDLADLPISEPVFIAVGNVPSTSISATGYATTDPGYFLQVKDAPFGGTLNILGNLSNFRNLGATHYRVNVSKDGAPPVPLALSWNAYRWNPATSRYELAAVAPVPGDDRYAIPPEYPAAPHRWIPAFLMMRWPSGENGLYTFSVEIFRETAPATFTDLTFTLPVAANSLTLKIDNTPPDVDLVSIYQHGSATPVAACEIVSAPVISPALYDVRITAHDPNGHMYSYGVVVLWGDDDSGTVIPTVTSPLPLWTGVVNERGPAAGWEAQCNCAHTFIVHAWKRTIDGYGRIYYDDSHQSITINNTGVSCP